MVTKAFLNAKSLLINVLYSDEPKSSGEEIKQKIKKMLIRKSMKLYTVPLKSNSLSRDVGYTRALLIYEQRAAASDDGEGDRERRLAKQASRHAPTGICEELIR